MPKTFRRHIRKLWYVVAGLVSIVLIFLFGYFSLMFEIDPMYKFISRVENKIKKTRGRPTLAVVETTFLRLKGEVFELPNNDNISGGALTVWDEDLLVMDRLGKVYFLDDDDGLIKSRVRPPENGLKDYIAISKSEKYQDYLHKIFTVRFNDITFIDEPDLRGFAFSYTNFDLEKECYGTRISWLEIPQDVKNIRELTAEPEDWKTVFDTSPCLPLNPDATALDGVMAGGRTAFSAPSTLYLGSGDYGLNGIITYDIGVQADDNSYGKVLAIDLKSGQSRIVSKGHRNIQGMALDSEGRLWTTEHAVRGGDELNLIKEGGNYGWPLQSLGTRYSGQPLSTLGTYGRHDLFDAPIYAWLPSAAISSLAIISGFDESWDGDLLAGSLANDEFGRSLFHIRIRDERVVFVERIELGVRIRYVTQYGPDKIAVWLDFGELVIFTKSRRANPLEKTRNLVADEYGVAMSQQVMRALQTCSQCHSFEQFGRTSGPSLNGVVGRKIAGTSYEGYSASLQAQSGKWDVDKLRSFLTNPDGFAPGTAMPATGLNDGELLDALIWALDQTDTGKERRLWYN